MNVQTNTYFRDDNLVEKTVRNKWFWILFVSLAFAFPFIKSIKRELPPELPVMGSVPEWKLIDENGKAFSSQDLHGKIYVASFFFSSCPTVCPKIMSALQLVQKRTSGLGTHFAIASFTVDPETDVPQVLQKKAREVKANPFVWKFLTGEQADLEKLLVHGFKVPMGEREALPNQVSLYDIAHTQKLVLVDKNGQIRGYYSIDRASVDKLMIDLGLLANRNESMTR